jgi:ATP-dependent DNA helicase RecG
MNRLLEGDVGSGKTVVAAMASAMVAVKGMQVFILAPTEILARQHSETFSQLLEPLELADTVSLLVGSMKPAQKKVAYESIADGRTKIIIGTHALLQEKLDAHTLGLIIIDEQHRFGVDQRRTLLEKAGHMPHMLSMTATPIPRSLALTVYGDLDVSILKNKPKNRKPVVTELVIQNERTKAYLSLNERLKKKEQIFVVCPLIEKNEFNTNRSVDKVFKELNEDIYSNFKVGYVHGRMKSDEKQTIMQQFTDGKIDVLVSTTVIEVGVDVPNATVMVVESPERFGLAQVHQLRGRVGRGNIGGLCLLMMSDNNQPTRRLKALEQSNDGFALSELDLKIRGPGAIYGTSQHGILDLRMVDFSDTTLIKRARDSAKQLFDNDPNLLQYPQLKQRIEKLQKITHLN